MKSSRGVCRTTRLRDKARRNYLCGAVGPAGAGAVVAGAVAAGASLRENLAVLLRYQINPPVARRATMASSRSNEPRQDFM